MAELNRHKLLNESSHFCMLPWTHMHFWPNGDTFPCCEADQQKPIGAVGQMKIEELWNSTALKQIRKNMLEDKPSTECNRCILLEREMNGASYRQTSNQRFADQWDKVETTQPDGSVPVVNMALLDVRFSNLCNFRCRTCGPDLSSGWFEDHHKLLGRENGNRKLINLESRAGFWQELEPLLPSVKHAVFAGGEPLLSEGHYRILDHWLKLGKLDVQITYITNFSQLQFRTWNALDYWHKFPKIVVAASLDASGTRAEYLRKGTDWNRIVENRREMMKKCPDVCFEITPTISAFNLFHFPDFHLDWVEQGLLDVDAIHLNLLSSPSRMSISILPEEVKRSAAEKYRIARDLLILHAEERGIPYGRMKKGYDSLIGCLERPEANTEPQLELKKRFLREAVKLDEIRLEKLTAVFPELEAMGI